MEEKKSELEIEEAEKDLSLIALCTFAVAAVIIVLLGIRVCKLPVVLVCIYAVIETAMAACLHNLPVWVHILIIAAELMVGILCDQMWFMLFMGILYIVAIAALYVIQNSEMLVQNRVGD